MYATREYGNEALQILQDFPDDKLELKVLLGICWSSCLLGNYREGLDRGREAEILAGKLGDKKSLSTAFSFIANIYLDLSDFHKASTMR